MGFSPKGATWILWQFSSFLGSTDLSFHLISRLEGRCCFTSLFLLSVSVNNASLLCLPYIYGVSSLGEILPLYLLTNDKPVALEFIISHADTRAGC